MSQASFTARGLDSLELILQALPRRGSISFPDFICDEVVDLLRRYFDPAGMRPYVVNHHLAVDWGTVRDCDVLYAVDYFGADSDAALLWDGPVIHDAVWMPEPLRELEDDEWWFNSFRKFAWPERGSIVIGQRRLTDADAPEPPVRLADMWRAREPNYAALEHALGARHGVKGGFMPSFPSVFPMIARNRPAVLAALAAEGITLPGMWKNAHRLPNDLYETLMLVPCDGRFSIAEIERRAAIIEKHAA